MSDTATKSPATTIRRVALANLAKKASQGDKLSGTDWRVLERYLALEGSEQPGWLHGSLESLSEAIGRTTRQIQYYVNEGMPAGVAYNEIAVRLWCLHRGVNDLKEPTDAFTAQVIEQVNRILEDRLGNSDEDSGEIRNHGAPKSWREEAAKQEAIKRRSERSMLDMELDKRRGQLVAKEDAEGLARDVLARCQRAMQVCLQFLAERMPDKERETFDALTKEAEEKWQIEVANDNG